MVPFLSFDEEGGRLQSGCHEENDDLHQYNRQAGHKVLLQNSDSCLRQEWQARGEDRAEAVPVRVQKLDKISRRNREGKSMKS